MTYVNREDCYPAAGAEDGLNEWKHRRDYGFIVFAGALIGFGAGMLVDYVGSGFLIGLGLGFLSAGLIHIVRKPLEGKRLEPHGRSVTLLLIGAFLVFTGTGIVLAPVAIWPYAIAGFLILIGIWFLVRGFARVRGCTRFS